MKNKAFTANNLEQCLALASQELGLPTDKLRYKIIDEKKGLFKKSLTISVEYEEVIKINENDGTVKIEQGKIIIKNPKENGRAAVLIPSKNIRLLINGEEIKARHEVYEEDTIETPFEEIEGKRLLNVSVNPDKLKAFVSIEYNPAIIYGLKDMSESTSVLLEECKKEEVYPPSFNVEEIKEELKKLGIEYGIIEENLMKCAENKEINNLPIAEGIAPVNDEHDKIKLFFETNRPSVGVDVDDKVRIDYKNIGAVATVNKGDTIAQKIVGEVGSDGVDVYGKTLKKKDGKKINLRIGGGCILKGEDTVIADIDGKPCIKNNIFYVYEVHEVAGDVDIKTGNIQFIGDVKISGNVLEGMRVIAGNSITVEKGVENAQILAKGDIEIKGSVLLSRIAAGGEDVLILRYMTDLKEMKTSLANMIETIMEIKRFNLLGNKTSDGEMVKVLLENKYKHIQRITLNILRDSSALGMAGDDDVLINLRSKLIGMAPLAIKHFSEIEDIISSIDNKLALLEKELSLPVTVKVAYCQDCDIKCSGDIFITGKGEYVSKIISHKGLYFTDNKSVARGGTLEARDEIKAKIVGSSGGVSTRLSVEAKGHIWADIAYQNTVFVIGGKEAVLETPSKNVHAYLNDKGELIIDKFNL
jgi:uncharacterized protein